MTNSNNTMRTIKTIATSAFLAVLFFGCGGTAAVLSTPIENIDTSPLKVSELTEAEKHNWGHLDLVKDTIPGMSVDKAYAEIIKTKKGKKVIVAVVDSGIDIDHEDLNEVIWTNKGEIPNNGIDDDKNGYVDDVHGWNFLGDGYDEQLEYVRILASGDTSNPEYEKAKAEYEKEYQLWSGRKTQYDQIYQRIKSADEALSNHLNKKDYTKEDVQGIKTDNQEVTQAVQMMNYMYSNGLDSIKDAYKEIEGALESINDKLNYHLNKDFKGRINGDNPDDMSTKYYGNGNVKPVKKSESHGTHVAGIIASERNDGLGANGVSNNVEIMAVRTVPNGDEYDKDVALGVYYAVDNGAKVINMSFGKNYSPNREWVIDAIKYAESKDVLLVHAAGNDHKDIDRSENWPNDSLDKINEVADNVLTIGAMSVNYNENLLATFTNYGQKNVDIFAPGVQIYSTIPNNEYARYSGTSMASPEVAGVAALVRSYYPQLSASQVKHIIMNSGTELDMEVLLPGEKEEKIEFSKLSITGKVANAYNALVLADKMVNGK